MSFPPKIGDQLPPTEDTHVDFSRVFEVNMGDNVVTVQVWAEQSVTALDRTPGSELIGETFKALMADQDNRWREITGQQPARVRRQSVDRVLYLRCITHRGIGQLNKTEHSGGECGECARELGRTEGRMEHTDTQDALDAKLWRRGLKLGAALPCGHSVDRLRLIDDHGSSCTQCVAEMAGAVGRGGQLAPEIASRGFLAEVAYHPCDNDPARGCREIGLCVTEYCWPCRARFVVGSMDRSFPAAAADAAVAVAKVIVQNRPEGEEEIPT